VTFNTANGVLAANLAANAGGTYPLTFTLTNSLGSVTQNFTLKVTVGFISQALVTLPSTQRLGFTVRTTGLPVPTLTISSGSLPGGVTFTDNHNGTATLSGSPAIGTYKFTIAATNNVATVHQPFTLTVFAPPNPHTGAVAKRALMPGNAGAGSEGSPVTSTPTPAQERIGLIGGSALELFPSHALPGAGPDAVLLGAISAYERNTTVLDTALAEWLRIEEDYQKKMLEVRSSVASRISYPEAPFHGFF
jgi:hypothetical protein